jgi:hypothetical protein
VVNGNIARIVLTYANGIKQAIAYGPGPGKRPRSRSEAIAIAEQHMREWGGTWVDHPAPVTETKCPP